ncbi:hypothetical protein CIHG_07603 [Coccidioides immitis H538.4]|uniref:Uncharacterized protein n=2 Tax=Coccidioides immitis TaxID=5501 RepID=A0A0J8RXN6_COCIT|nr:hypothetical protein CIRG_07894 [Coccidioides immitis RMSCC 2394]KMU89920.1 hypothetical protein CIHG_07603 [Coccidioides immitis H538.4]
MSSKRGDRATKVCASTPPQEPEKACIWKAGTKRGAATGYVRGRIPVTDRGRLVGARG